MKATVVYPRGFVGLDIGLPVQRESSDLSQTLKAMRYNRNTPQRGRTVVSNQDIDSLYLGLVRGERTTKSFDFKEKVFRAALTCWGTDNFFEWCQLQEKSLYLTDLHKRFLNDTFRFIQFGERQMGITTWISLLRVRDLNVEDAKTAYLYKEFFGLGQSALFQRPITTEGAIQAWTSQPGGLVDMLGTLRVLFGDTVHQ